MHAVSILWPLLPLLTSACADATNARYTAEPALEAVPATILPAPTAVGLPPALGFSVNVRIQPRGRPASWYVEYGATSDYGVTTAARALPGRLDAHFAEDWADGSHGWTAGFTGLALEHHDHGGPDDGPFMRYTDEGSAGNDVNHLDGIGLIHLGPYIYPGNFYWAEVPPLYLGGGFPDMRGARVSLDLRGVDWQPHGTTIGTWIQAYIDPTVVEVLPEDSRYPNWACTGQLQADKLVSGAWEHAAWTLRDLTIDWTFAGANGGRPLYDYGELDTILRGVNVDMFIFQILHVDLNDMPTGSIDSANLDITYRQHSVCAASNGGSLVAEPAGGSGAAFLSDGWGGGRGREWQSVPNPREPQIFEYAFANPILVTSVNVHNAVENPSRDISIEVSADGGASWTEVSAATLPDAHALGPNFAFHHVDAWVLANEIAVWAPLHPLPVDRLRVTVTSGYQDGAWGLGEIEAFGSGAVEETDDDWYELSQDVRVEAGTWHFRSVAVSDGGTAYGPDQIAVVKSPPP